ncbi:MAG: hypothetical protein D6693_01120 [Planctomycetota bacterium]|nr:MAG: hypothetical protein D6693_01120 [Planctomycetota bacterium]
MRFSLLLVFAAVIVLGFIGFMLTYTVRFTEVGVVTTFGSANEESVVREAGLKWRAPYPVQKVTKYDTRVRVLNTRSETLQTADNRQVIAQAFVAWRVSDPLRFFQRFGGAGADARDHYREAQRAVEDLVRGALGAVSGYTFSDLFAADGSRLAELEAELLDRLRGDADGTRRLADLGIEAEFVGISQLVLPAETTEAVFARMKAQRERLAAEATSRGEALAQTIINDAESAAARIRAFAEQRAEQIRVQGEIEAAQYIATLNQAKNLAVFLDQLEFMKKLLGRNTTLVLSTAMPGLGIFRPDALAEDRTDADGVPVFSEPKAPAVATGQEREE